MTQAITTLTFFRFATLSDRFWAFGQMQFAHAHLARTPGLTFYKLMGSGKGAGFACVRRSGKGAGFGSLR